MKGGKPSLAWHCPCGKTNGKAVPFCGWCQGSWMQGRPHQQNPPGSAQSSKWSGQYHWQDHGEAASWYQDGAHTGQWPQPWTPRWSSQKPKKEKKKPKSPRDKTPRGKSPRGQQSGAPKQQAPPAEPSWQTTTPSVPAVPAAPTTPAPSQEAILLKTLVQALKGKEGLSSEVQTLIEEADIRDGRASTKQMHNMVSRIGSAQKTLAEATRARAQLHQAWRNFLVEAVSRWNGYTEDFAGQDAALADRISKAQAALTEARKNGSKFWRKEAQGSQDVAATELVQDSEEEKEGAEDGEPMDLQVDAQIQGGIVQMKDALGTLSKTAEELAASSERIAKRRRTAQEDGGLGKDGPSDFASAGK